MTKELICAAPEDEPHFDSCYQESWNLNAPQPEPVEKQRLVCESNPPHFDSCYQWDYSVVAPQPDPKPSEGGSVWPLVINDMYAREKQGFMKYGTPLKAFNGRNALIDAYQEALDLAVYLRQAIEERKNSQ